MTEVEVEDSQEQAEKPAARGIDSLVNTPLLSMEDILKERRLWIIFGSSLVNYFGNKVKYFTLKLQGLDA